MQLANLKYLYVKLKYTNLHTGIVTSAPLDSKQIYFSLVRSQDGFIGVLSVKEIEIESGLGGYMAFYSHTFPLLVIITMLYM